MLTIVSREKILSLLGLPPSTSCEYRSNKALLDAASSLKDKATDGQGGEGGHQQHTQHHGHQHTHQGTYQHGQHQRQHHDRGHFRDTRGPRDDAGAPGEGRRTGGWGNGFRREP
jgi:translation initiation factor 4E